MKTLFTCFIILLGMTGKSQFFTWTEPVPLTDSVHNNTNCSIQVGDPMISPNPDYAVWESSSDTLSIAIFGRNLETMEDPFPILSQPGVHFRNPKRVPVFDGNVLFYLFYETDINGNWDIYYVEYLMDGTVTEPVQVCATQADERNFQFSDGVVVWQSDDQIVTQEYDLWSGFPPGSQPEVLDSVDCQYPVFSGYYCAWEKVVSNISQVWFASREYVSGQWIWSSPMLIDSTGENRHLYMGDFLTPSTLVWQHYEDDFWRIKGIELDYLTMLPVPDFPGCNNVDPCFLNLTLPVWQTNPFPFSFMTWASDSSGNKEIYVNETIWDPYYFNISGYPSEDRNPKLFSSYNFIIRVYLTWESFRNGHWQIWISWQDIWIGIPGEKGMNRLETVTAFPNPFSGETMLQFELPGKGKYKLEIFTSTGLLEYSFSGDAMGPGKQNVAWNGRTTLGTRLPAGQYMIRVQSDDAVLHGKVIIQI